MQLSEYTVHVFKTSEKLSIYCISLEGWLKFNPTTINCFALKVNKKSEDQLLALGQFIFYRQTIICIKALSGNIFHLEKTKFINRSCIGALNLFYLNNYIEPPDGAAASGKRPRRNLKYHVAALVLCLNSSI